MAFTYDITSTNQVKIQLASITEFRQDDGFGDTINTFNICKNDNEISDFVHNFLNDQFNFVG